MPSLPSPSGSADGDAGAVEGGVDRVLRAEFTPTTAFRPQTRTLTVGAFRAWNGLADRHEYGLVRVRAAPMHDRSEAVNARLAEPEAASLETGAAKREPNDGARATPTDGRADAGGPRGPTDAPFK